MSLQKGLEQIEPKLRKKNRQGGSKKSSKWYKLFRNRWLRRFNKLEVPNVKFKRDYEH